MHNLFTFSIIFPLVFIFLPELDGQDKDNLNFRSDCAAPRAQTELSINNVRAKLLIAGDMWWDLEEAGYIVPKNLGVAAVFAGAIWMGAKDPTGNLKVAAQTYRTRTRNDYFAGPLDEYGENSLLSCNQWDRFFRVKADEVHLHINRFAKSREHGIPYPYTEIPDNILGWPAVGNPFFAEINGFSLPNMSTALASFRDHDGDGIYNPTRGDYPVLCSSMPGNGNTGEMIPSEQVFHIFNDVGVHTQSQGLPLGVQVNATSFAFQSDDEINDMTFYQYKVHNRSAQDLDDMLFSLWMNPDLGCYADDYFGVDTMRDMFYVYNEDAIDGLFGCECADVPSYCENIPILGMRFYNTPDQMGISSFSYYFVGLSDPLPPMRSPNSAIEFYRFMSGVWRDGTPITIGGDGLNFGSNEITKYVFPSPPNEFNSDSWSFCSANLGYGDRVILGSTSFGKFESGAHEEVLFGLVYVPSQQYPCPDISYLQFTSDKAKIFLLNELLDGELEPKGPDAPDMTAIESDQEITILLSNDAESNNYLESYREKDPLFRDSTDKDEFNFLFEGYVVYQLAGNTVQASELTDESKARIVYQSDLKNEVTDIYNWQKIEDPFEWYNLFVPELMVEGRNEGVRNSFRLTEDAFATGEDRSLVNHKPYYYMAIAYAHNSFRVFDPVRILGQREPFLAGSQNLKMLTAIPRSSEDGGQSMVYGTPFPVTRIDGAGNPGVFLELEEGMYDQMLSDDFSGEIKYKKGFGPVLAKVVDPGNLRSAKLQLALYNEDGFIGVNDETRWVLRNVDTGEEIFSDFNLSRFSEQIVDTYGISIEMYLADSIGINRNGSIVNEKNGIVDTRFKLLDPEAPKWLKSVGSSKSLSISDDEGNQFFPLKYVKNDIGEIDYHLDPTQAFTSTSEPGFIPFYITAQRPPSNPGEFLVGPMIQIPVIGGPQDFRLVNAAENSYNVDLVLTSDKSLWTRSIVIQTSSALYKFMGFEPSDNTDMFDYREHPSIGKDGRYATEDGTKTGTVLTGSSTNPDDPNYINPQGMGWFPGYAVDVETGRRLNILYGENSSYNEVLQDEYNNGEVIGDDMIWNPSDQKLLNFMDQTIVNYFMGGQHFIYITNSNYDGGASMFSALAPNQNLVFKLPVLNQITWSGFTILEEGQELRSYEDGLIPHDMVIQLRANQKYSTTPGGSINGMPHYLIDIDADGILGNQNVVDKPEGITAFPNPFLSFRHIELTLCDLPQNCDIYMFDAQGRIVMHQKLDGIIGEKLESYSIELNKIKMAAGVYFLRIDAPGEEVQTLKVLYL